MIVIIRKDIAKEELEPLIKDLNALNIRHSFLTGNEYDLLRLEGNLTSVDEKKIHAFEFVSDVIKISPDYKKVKAKDEDNSVNINGLKIGRNESIVVIAGPCSIENYDQVKRIGNQVKHFGASILRAGAYKPRTSPYSFQGLKSEGIDLLRSVKEELKMPIVSEVTSVLTLSEFEDVDIIQVGARNMQNYELLKAVARLNKPVLLKRGFANTIEEWLMSAEYIIKEGNKDVILCERGVRTFEPSTRFSIDFSVIPIVKKLSNLPVIVDPSHASGHYELVESLSLAAIAAGADGLIIEVHDRPFEALSDGIQSIKPERFAILMEKAKKVANAIGRDML